MAEAGNTEAPFKLGWIYVRGEGFTGLTYVRDIPKDLSKAHVWYQKAAAQGNEIAKKPTENRRKNDSGAAYREPVSRRQLEKGRSPMSHDVACAMNKESVKQKSGKFK